MENVQMVLDAISKVKEEAKEAAKAGDLNKYRELMGNLLALQNCLVTETEKLIKAA